MWNRNILVVANVTAISDELQAVLRERASGGPTKFTLIVPATRSAGGRKTADERLHRSLERLRAADIDVDGEVADSDPIVAVREAWDPRLYDEIIVCTLPMGASRWLRSGLPGRIAELTGATVTHVLIHPPQHLEIVAAPERQPHSMGPLEVLTWGGPKAQSSRAPVEQQSVRRPN